LLSVGMLEGPSPLAGPDLDRHSITL
jgi:hypothetical protein